MNDLFTPLTDEELNRLDDFLLDRVDEDEYVEGMDEGILDISALDGFMTAIVSGPNMVPPSQWLPAVWGNFEPVWESDQQFEEIMTLMMRHMNGIAGMLMDAPDDFDPIFMQHEVDGKVYSIVDEWCEGYLRGMALDIRAWKEAEEIKELLGILLLFASESGWEELKQMTDEEVEKCQDMIAPAVRSIHAYWLAQRKNMSTMRREGTKVGRNDPCPCGSGQKFKKCCGTGPTLH